MEGGTVHFDDSSIHESGAWTVSYSAALLEWPVAGYTESLYSATSEVLVEEPASFFSNGSYFRRRWGSIPGSGYFVVKG